MTRPRRALLFVPGVERKRIEKASGLGADGVILDLEDAVAGTKKAEARTTTFESLSKFDFGRSERIVRINAVGSGLELEDLRMLTDATTLPDAVMIPKVERPEDIRAIAARLAAIESARGIPNETIRLLAIIESARGAVNLVELAQAHPRVVALVFGAEDLAGDVGATRTKSGHEVAWTRRALVLHAAAFRLQAIDTPFVDLNDSDALVADTRTGLELGYTGRLAIHPRQLQPILSVFTPTPEQLAAAERLLEAHAGHQAAGVGVFDLDGRMVDMPMVRAAERVVARAKQAGLR